MGLELGNLLGAAANITSSFSKEKNLKQFLKNIDKFGVQVANNFEVNFSGLQDATFFVQSIDFGGLKQNMTSLYYDGRELDVPINHEYEHSGSMIILNDAQGYIYSAITSFLLSDSTNVLANSGYTMIIKCLTGGEKKSWKGSTITLRGVRFETVSGLSFGYSNNEISTFTLQFKYIDFSFTPGALGKVAGVFGAANSLLNGK